MSEGETHQKPRRAVKNFVVFTVMCIITAVTYTFRYDIYFYISSITKNHDVAYDADGNEMTLIKSDELSEMFENAEGDLSMNSYRLFP